MVTNSIFYPVMPQIEPCVKLYRISILTYELKRLLKKNTENYNFYELFTSDKIKFQVIYKTIYYKISILTSSQYSRHS